MPEPVVREAHVGTWVIPVEHWRCAWCHWEAADLGAVRRHEERCPQRDDGLW